MAETPQKKLLIVITKSNFGGAQRYVLDLSRSLVGRYDVAVACGGNGTLVEKLKEAGVRTIPLTTLGRNVSPLKDLHSLLSLALLIRKERPDVLHLNSSKVGIMGAIAALVSPRTKTVFTAHAWAFNENRGPFSKLAIGTLHWLTVFLCTRAIAVSQGVKDQMAHLPFMKEKIEVIHLGIDPFNPLSRDEARTRLLIPKDAFAIGTIAELHPVKGLEYALGALKTLPFPYSYTLIGTGDLKESLEKIVADDVTLKASARLTGFIPDAWTLIPAFDVFLLPSLSEAFGYVLLEAGYSHTPVIATSVGGIPEIIKDMESGVLIHSKSQKEIASSLAFIHQNRKAADGFGDSLEKRVRTEFSLARMVEKTSAVYEK
ncbi:MAG: glycosyltransferase [Candidatus Paceibacterota bacterium]|jgi:glycosyltransferase involved in cell wall biosynthesis